MTKRNDLEAVEVEARNIGRVIGKSLPPNIGFGLVLFSFGEDGFLTYISNAQREDMVKALRECADKIEQRKEI